MCHGYKLSDVVHGYNFNVNYYRKRNKNELVSWQIIENRTYGRLTLILFVTALYIILRQINLNSNTPNLSQIYSRFHLNSVNYYFFLFAVNRIK